MAEIITAKIALGVSACIDRCPVRYNGRALDSLSVLGRERSDFVLTPVCPECLAGLGVHAIRSTSRAAVPTCSQVARRCSIATGTT